MSKTTFMTIIIFAAVFSLLSVGANGFAKSSGGDSSSGGDGGGNDKPKTLEHKKGDDGGGMPVPGVPAVRVDNKHKDKDSNGGGPIVPGLPAVPFNGDDNHDDGSSGYNNGNIKKFDTSKSSFRIGGSNGKVVEYMPGFNETFYNSTLPYCFAVTTGACYDNMNNRVLP
jgi:hypothetical protein